MDTWPEFLKWLIVVLVMLLGSPLTQWFKNRLNLADQWALFLTGIISAGVAMIELWLTGVLDFAIVTIDTLPTMFMLVFTVATVYFKLLKGTNSVLGSKFLLKE